MTQHATARAKDLEVKTEPPVLKLGTTPQTTVPRPDLAGLRLITPNNPAIYLVDPLGFLRWIPDPATYNNLFRDWNGIVTDVDLINIAQGGPLSSGALLAQGIGTFEVYLVSNAAKRWITSPAAMDKYYFNWDRIVQVPDILVEYIPLGPNWS